MNESEADAVIVQIAPGDYKLRKSFHITRSNVTLEGGKRVALQLVDRALQPVIAVGSQSLDPTESERISNIRISDLAIDGNKDAQPSEFHRELPWIRNNGIDVRVVTGLTVERVTSNNNRSGGLVISWRCRDVMVRNCSFERNFFDGVAYYDSSEVYTVDCSMRRNDAAGVSLDNEFVDSIFLRCDIDSNRNVGVFARNSERLVFYDCKIQGSGDWAFFLSHDRQGRGVFDVDIASCSIENNRGGVRMASNAEGQSARNSLTFSAFANNSRSGREDLSTAGSKVWTFDEPWTAPDAAAAGLDQDPAQPKPYSQKIYQVLNEIDGLNRG